MPAYDLTDLQSDIAQIQHEKAGFGTGRLVAENLILTAAHTLFNRDIGTDPICEQWQVRLAGDRSNGPWLFRRGDVVWCDEVRDLALIRLADWEDGPIRPRLRLRIATISRVNAHPVEARGYPRASKEADGPRELTLALGRLTAADSDRPLRFGVDDCDLPNDPHAGWPGMSGSAVLRPEWPDSKTIWVYGVVQKVPANFNQQLDVARLADAWADPVFRSLLVRAGAPDMDAADPTGAPEPFPNESPGPNPFKGLLHFEEPDADRFFGREKLTKELCAKLVESLSTGEDRPRLLPVVGPSGSGKSSLVRAGLVPLLRCECLSQPIEPRVLVLTPGSHPLEALARALARLTTPDGNALGRTEEILGVLTDSGRGDGLRRIVDDLPMLGPARLVLVIDQFEELYVTPAAPKEREIFEADRDRFIATLLNAASDRGGRMIAVIVMRSDFLGETQRHPELNACIARSCFLVPAMGKEELEDAIRKPAEQSEPPYHFQPAFVDLLVNEVLGRPGALPLLEFALQRVWDALPADPAETLDNLGGVGGVVAVSTENEFSRLSDRDKAIARRAFLAMVNLGEGTADTRRRARLDEITTDPNSAEPERSVLMRFSRPEVRLITLGQGPGGVVTFEVAHETLIRRWERLQKWLDESRDDLRFLHRASEAARLWANREGSLYGSIELGRLRDVAQRAPEDMTASLTAFLDASQADEKAEQLRERRHRRLLRSWAAAATLFFTLTGFGSVFLAFQLETERRMTYQLLVEQAEKAAQAKDYFQALDLAVYASEMRPKIDPEYDQRAYEVVREILAANQRLIRIMRHDGPVWGATFDPTGEFVASASNDGTARLWDAHTGAAVGVPMRHDGPVFTVAFDPTGERVATGSQDNTARLWNARTGEPVGKPMRHRGPVMALAFDPTGAVVITASQDNTARLWNARTGEPVGKPMLHNGFVTAVAFDAHGERVVTGSEDGTARLWDARTGEILSKPMQHDNAVLAVAFDPKGELILTGSRDKTARLWNAHTGEQVRLMEHSGPIWAVAFDRLGELIVTASGDRTARVWNARTGELTGKPMMQDAAIRTATIDSMGQLVVTGSLDNTAYLWDARTGEPISKPMRHENRLTVVAFDPRGERVITGSEDNTLRLWDVRTAEPIERPLLHDGLVRSVAFDYTGKTLATGSDDKTARLWSTSTAQEIGVPMQHDGAVVAIAFDLGDEVVVTGSSDRMARLWNARTGEPIGRPMQHDGPVRAVAFDPKGEFVVTGSDDNTARLWNTRTGESIGKPMRHDGPVIAVAVHPGGGLVATGSQDNTARLWNTRTGEPVGKPMRHDDALTAIAFSPDGRLLATASAWNDKTAKLWNARTGEPVGRPMQHNNVVNAVAFDPKSELLATGSDDNEAQLWDTRTGEKVGKPMQHGGPVVAVAFDRRGRFLATGSYDRTARLWNAHTGEPIGRPMRHGGEVSAVAFNPQGKLLATGSLENFAHLWLALSAQTLFARGRMILGPDTRPAAIPSSLDFLSWVEKKIGGAG